MQYVVIFSDIIIHAMLLNCEKFCNIESVIYIACLILQGSDNIEIFPNPVVINTLDQCYSIILIMWLSLVSRPSHQVVIRDKIRNLDPLYIEHSSTLWIEMFCMVHTSGETIRVNAVLHIVFEYIAIYCHIAIFVWILVKREEYGFW